MDHTCQEHVPGSMPRSRRRRGREGRANPPWQDAPGHRMFRFHGDGLLSRHPGLSSVPCWGPLPAPQGRDLPCSGGPAALTPSGMGLSPHKLLLPLTPSDNEVSPSHVQRWRRSSSRFSSPSRATAETTAPSCPCGSRLHLPTCPPYPGAPRN